MPLRVTIRSRIVLDKLWRRFSRPLALATTLAGLALGVAWIVWLGLGQPVDAGAYYFADRLQPYASHLSLETPGAYLYSPAFVQVIAPLTSLSFGDYIRLVRLADVAILGWLLGPLTLPAMFWSPVPSEINAGNIDLFLGVAIVVGFRWPGTWAFVVLTKVTPGVGLVWFAIRREWNALAQVVVATGGIIVVSVLVFGPHFWVDWLSVLRENSSLSHDAGMPVPWPLVLRLPLAALLVAWGGRTDRRATLPIAALLALPWIWYHSLSMLAAAVYLIRKDGFGSRKAVVTTGAPP